VLNKPSTQPLVDSFKVFIHSIGDNGVIYPVAQSDTFYKSLPPSRPGQLSYNVTKANDSATAPKNTIYTFSLWPTHSIPSASAISLRFPDYTPNMTQGPCTLTGLSTQFATTLACKVVGRELILYQPFGSNNYTNTSNPLKF
jgi:hypothetical protein